MLTFAITLYYAMMERGNGDGFQHSMKRRWKSHKYNRKGTYMLTMVVEGRRPLLGTLVTKPLHVSLSPLGIEIRYYSASAIEAEYPMAKVWRICVMPDHIHMIVRIAEDMPVGMHLGDVVKGFKIGCNRDYRRLCGVTEGNLFEEGYCDRVLLSGDQLKRWKRYLSDNPRRLAIKREFPQFFHTIYDWPVCRRNCQLYGNRFLLEIPDKVAVVVHRRDTDSEHEERAPQMARLRRAGRSAGERSNLAAREGSDARSHESRLQLNIP